MPWFHSNVTSSCSHTGLGMSVIFMPIIIIIVVVVSLVTGPFFLVCFLNQRWTPSLRFQVSHCSAFRSMCDVPSIAVICKKSIECVPGIACRFFFKLRVTIPVAPIITGMIVHFRFHIRSISLPKLLYLSFFSASFCTTFRSSGIATSISVRVFSFLFLIIISGLFAVTSLSVYYYYYYYYWCYFLLIFVTLKILSAPLGQCWTAF